MALETPRRAAGSPEAEETPTVCGEDLSQSPSIAPESSKDTPPPTLKERMPAPSRVLAEVTKNHTIQFLLRASKFFNNGKSILLEDALWQRVNDRIHDSLKKCAASSQEDITKMSKLYLTETQDIINNFASKLHDHLPPDQKVDNKEDIINASLLLQSISVEYVDTLHELISYSSKGEKLTISEQVRKKVTYASAVSAIQLFPVPGVQKNVYYIIGFLGSQGRKEAERRAKNSGVRACLTHFASKKYLIRNKGQAEEVEKLIADSSIPTGMVEAREAFGGLAYASKECWEFFAVVEYVYAELATPDNFLCRGGKLLREICEGILDNNVLKSKFAALCDYDKDSEEGRDGAAAAFTLDDATTTFEFFLKVFGRVRAKDVALKYNSQVFKGNNQVNFRASIGSQTGIKGTKTGAKKGSKKKEKPPKKKQKADTATAADQPAEAHHNELLDELSQMDKENADDSNKNKICSDVVDDMIENDASEDLLNA